MRSDRFLRHQEIPLQTDFTRLKQVNLGIYEYKDARPLNPTQTLEMDIPLMGESLHITFDMLLNK